MYITKFVSTFGNLENSGSLHTIFPRFSRCLSISRSPYNQSDYYFHLEVESLTEYPFMIKAVVNNTPIGDQITSIENTYMSEFEFMGILPPRTISGPVLNEFGLYITNESVVMNPRGITAVTSSQPNNYPYVYDTPVLLFGSFLVAESEPGKQFIRRS